ncbi:ATP-dependent 3'-5' DNA helicase [Candidozyma auris]|uniref:DEXH box helicase n=2 Tax=Candidozyma auris TaxID=498019 RepID=A0A8F3AGI7_CANAR|nr:ATP-dependent 3'-5' DNA helicase [[Candida] auris]KND96408.2 hypothetical protein QG37_07295 [[Candida] auris]QEO19647.1 hypothetical_protein [[Candida] auris]QWW22527.1 hypothetical protein CA7LBN_001273 [[Candida] auris]GBL50370.1 helicase/secretion neighborhood putative DEAH-box helicase [[Candida] auris]
MPWPESFNSLYRKFALINTHLTFLSSFSRQTIPTFEHIQKLNDDISRLDLQMIKDLLPDGDVTFDYIDENQLLIGERIDFKRTKGGLNQNQPRSIDDAYEAVARKNADKPEKQLLVFEFCDVKVRGIGAVIKGKDKWKKAKTTKSPSPPKFFTVTKELTMESLSQEQLRAIIAGRNEFFTSCVDEYLESFTQEEIEEGVPFKALVEKNVKNIPEPSYLSDPVEVMTVRNTEIVSDEKPNVETMLQTLKEKPLFRDQISTLATLTEQRAARHQALSHELLHGHLVDALWDHKGIDALENGLYTHQAKALEAVLAQQKHVIVSTSTSSGKSLIYQLPVLSDILDDCDSGINAHRRTTTAMFIFPTKALAQDQKRHLSELIAHLPPRHRKITVDTYDGDTPTKDRAHIRNYADIIFTNPDAIHAAILPNHAVEAPDERRGWTEFLTNLKYVVIDELHVYKGTFGVHVSYVMARLNRLKAQLDSQSRTKYISCSATIKNPESHFRTICSIPDDEEIAHIHEDGSPSSEKKLILWEPPLMMNKKGQRELPQSKLKSATTVDSPIKSAFLPREHVVGESAKILIHLLCMLPSIKVILFCPIREVCELVIKECRTLINSKEFPQWSNISEHDIMSYRGGYSKTDRRAIEQKMFTGKLRAIVATNALELGIDLSDLDVVISCGFPGSKSNLHQQFGRAGRSRNSKGSLAILVCGSNPLDRFYLKNPNEVLDKESYEDLCVEGILDGSSNRVVMSMHLQCAAFEWPIHIEDDLRWFSPHNAEKMNETFRQLCMDKLHKDDNGYYRTDPRYLPWPAEKVSLRAIDDVMFAVVDVTNNRNVVIEEVEAVRTSFTLYEGGIFLHQGFPYLVKEFSFEGQYAKVERVKVTWNTQQRDFSDVDPMEIQMVKKLHPPGMEAASDIPVFFGKIQTTVIVFGYFKVDRKGEILDVVEVKNPPIRLQSKGLWIDIPTSAIEAIKEKSLSPAGGIHAAQHAIMNILPLFITGGATTNPNARWTSSVGDSELSTECKAPEKEFASKQSKRKRPARLIFHDSKGGSQGTGISAKTFEFIDEIIDTTYKRVSGCECEWGCPMCVTGAFCKENMLVMSKPAAVIILGTLIGHDLTSLVESVPDGPEPNMPNIGFETIVSTTEHIKFSPDVQIVDVRKARRKLQQPIKKEDNY